jgi:tellurite resistance protein
MLPAQLLPIITSLASSSIAHYIKRKQEIEEDRVGQDLIQTDDSELLRGRTSKSPIQLSEELSTNLRLSTIHSTRKPHPVYEDFDAPASGMWQEPGTTVNIGGITIHGGMFYVGDTLKGCDGQTDPSLINPALPVHISSEISDPPEWPDYSEMTAEQRANYLVWLAGDRDNLEISDGYLWLYICGIERYLLIDGPRVQYAAAARMQLENELLRILTTYHNRPRIAQAITTILAMNWANTHAPHFAEALPPYMNFAMPDSGDLFPWRLASLVMQRKPIPPRVMLEWYMHHPKYEQRNLTPDTFELFQILFTEQFEKAYGDGFVIPQTRIPLSVPYHAANTCLGTLVFDFNGACNVFEDCIYLERIKPIINKCAEALTPYAEYIKQPNPTAVGILARMPQNILKTYPPFLALQNLLAMSVQNGVAMINVQTLFETMGMPNLYAVTQENAKDMATLLQIAGFVCAPDIRYHNAIMPIQGQIVIAQRNEIPKKTNPFNIMAIVLQVGAIVAQIDEEISPTEVAILQTMIIERKLLNDAQRTSLLLWLHWCLHTPQNIDAIAKNLEDYPESLQTHISQILISVACADGIIDTREYIALLKLYRALKIPEALVKQHLAERDFNLDPQKLEALEALEKQQNKRQPVIHKAQTQKKQTREKTIEDEEFERMFYAESNQDEPLSEDLLPSSDTNYAFRPAQYDFNAKECVEIDANLNDALSKICEIEPLEPKTQN